MLSEISGRDTRSDEGLTYSQQQQQHDTPAPAQGADEDRNFNEGCGDAATACHSFAGAFKPNRGAAAPAAQ
jgi:hypothetical protein